MSKTGRIRRYGLRLILSGYSHSGVGFQASPLVQSEERNTQRRLPGFAKSDTRRCLFALPRARPAGLFLTTEAILDRRWSYLPSSSGPGPAWSAVLGGSFEGSLLYITTIYNQRTAIKSKNIEAKLSMLCA